jgi:protein JSN1
VSSQPVPSSRLLTLSGRARELEEGIGARYRPPALRGLASGGSPPNDLSSTTNTTSDVSSLSPSTGFPAVRRARAGTLPSNVQLAAQRFAAASSTLTSQAPSTESFADQLQQRQVIAPPASNTAAPVRPNLRHTASVASSAASSALTERNSRLRSGSLTLPAGGLSNAFGPSIFSSSWLSSRNGSGMPILDDLHSVASMESGNDDFDVHTLDYLGLDDTLRHPPAATITELRSQAQAAITGNLATHPSRHRASTVSHPYPRLGTSAGPSLLPTPSAEEDDIYGADLYHNQGLDVYDDPGNYLSAAYVAKGFKSGDHLGVGLSARPRAISVGNLDDTTRGLRRPGASDLQQSLYANELPPSSLGGGGLAPTGILRSDKLSGRTGTGPSVHFPSNDLAASRVSPYLQAPSGQNRSLSPKSAENSANQIQTPTRSLWIGNLDSSVTSEQLIHVFAPYGAIESLRLLPEKVRITWDTNDGALLMLMTYLGMWLRQFRRPG